MIKAISTENTFLLYKPTSTGTWQKLVDIKEFPDLGAAPNTIETTTLSDHMKTYINGLVDPGALEFTCNYIMEEYEKLDALDGTYAFGIQFGTGAAEDIFGAWTFDGELSVWAKGGSSDAVIEMGVSIAPSTELTFTKTALLEITETTE